MAITAGVSHAFKNEVLLGQHNFTVTTGNVFKIALYLTAATLGPGDATYSVGTANQSSGTGYTAGGNTLTNITPVLNGNEGCVSFATTTWTTSTITARGAQIYNSTNSNKSVAVLDFGSDKISSAGDFTITFPAQTAGNAIVRIT
jgi:hypothetical protein